MSISEESVFLYFNEYLVETALSYNTNDEGLDTSIQAPYALADINKSKSAFNLRSRSHDDLGQVSHAAYLSMPRLSETNTLRPGAAS